MSQRLITSDFLYERLPRIYRRKDKEIGGSLKAFLEVLAGGFKQLEDDIRNFEDLYDPDKCPANYLAYLGYILGFEFPFDMPESIQRKFLKIASKVYYKKGTKAALEYIIEEIMEFPSMIYDEDIYNKEYKIDVSAIADDPLLEEKKAKIQSLVEIYGPVGAKCILTFVQMFPSSYDDNVDNFIENMVDSLYDFLQASDIEIRSVAVGFPTKTSSRLNAPGHCLNGGFKLNHNDDEDTLTINGVPQLKVVR